jgi:hypothetical protein
MSPIPNSSLILPELNARNNQPVATQSVLTCTAAQRSTPKVSQKTLDNQPFDWYCVIKPCEANGGQDWLANDRGRGDDDASIL